MKQLIVNADDFGFTKSVNAGIVECHRHGILTATTLMATSDAFEDAVRLAHENPSLDIGVHLVLVGGHGQPKSVAGLMAQLARRRQDPADEMRRQVEAILRTGLQPTHLDTHKHTHLAPPVLNAVVRIAREFQIPWVRKPADFTMPANASPLLKKVVNAGVRFTAARFDRVLRRADCRFTDHFIGFQVTGRLGLKEILDMLRHMPHGVTELMCHPGYLSEELRSAPTRLKESREIELRALTAPETLQALRENGIQLAAYRDL